MTKRKENPGKGGRPPKYNKKFCAEMIAFFTREHYKKEEIERHVINTKYGENIHVKYKLIPTELPFFEAFARKIGVSYTTLYHWTIITKGKKDTRPRYPEFVQAHKECEQLRKEHLIDIGLVGATQAVAYIFTAKNLTDMVDKQLVDDTIREIVVTDGTEEGKKDATP